MPLLQGGDQSWAGTGRSALGTLQATQQPEWLEEGTTNPLRAEQPRPHAAPSPFPATVPTPKFKGMYKRQPRETGWAFLIEAHPARARVPVNRVATLPSAGRRPGPWHAHSQ